MITVLNIASIAVFVVLTGALAFSYVALKRSVDDADGFMGVRKGAEKDVVAQVGAAKDAGRTPR